MKTRRVVILGATGSIGTSALKVAKDIPERMQVVGLSAHHNAEALADLAKDFPSAKTALSSGSDGIERLVELATLPEADLVLIAIVGTAGLRPALAAIEAGKDIAVASKEILVMAGEIVMRAARQYGVNVLPVDSEHSAIFQALLSEDMADVERIIITASGGAFRDWPIDRLATATVAEASTHPNWAMGQRITIDSASMFNKALEMIEAGHLFQVAPERIEVVVHPQSIIHSMVELADSSVLAQLGWPDMKLPILYCLSWPERLETPWRRLDLTEVGSLTFRKPDPAKYPCMELAYAAGRAGGTMPAVMNAANEQAVALFLEEQVHFLDIPRLIERVCDRHRVDLTSNPSLDDVLAIDTWARQAVQEAAALPV